MRGGIEIFGNSDMNDFDEIGNFYCPASATVTTLKNCPFVNAFTLKVIYGTGVNYPTQIFTEFNTGKKAWRYFNSSGSAPSWSDFVYFSDDTSVLDQVANTSVPMKFITYTAQNKEEAINLLDNPTLLVGNKSSAYCIYFQDNVGDSPLGGGASMVLGYTYSNDDYGVQFYIKYNGEFRKRNKNNGKWTEFVNI